jgi:hypothetical protein
LVDLLEEVEGGGMDRVERFAGEVQEFIFRWLCGLCQRIDAHLLLDGIQGRLGVAINQEAAKEEEIAEGGRMHHEVALRHIALVARRQEQNPGNRMERRHAWEWQGGWLGTAAYGDCMGCTRMVQITSKPSIHRVSGSLPRLHSAFQHLDVGKALRLIFRCLTDSARFPRSRSIEDDFLRLW